MNIKPYTQTSLSERSGMWHHVTDARESDTMDYKELLSATVYDMDGTALERLKSMLSDMHIKFSFVKIDDVDSAVLSEKLSDYFQMVCMKTSKTIDDIIRAYMDGMNSIVEPRIAKTSQSNVISRARKYYERFAEMRLSQNKTIDDIVDYSRIMFCLYESILENDMNPIDDFDYECDALDPVAIIEAMRLEESRGLFLFQGSKLFDTSDTYEIGTCIIVIAMIMLFTSLYVTDDSEEDDDYEY